MKALGYSIVILGYMMAAVGTFAQDTSEASNEYKLKAAFIYNFLKFVEWSDDKKQDPNTPLIIGILGEDKFENAFDVVKNKTINGRGIQIQHYTSIAQLMSSGDIETVEEHPQMDAIKASHLLFISVSEKKYLKTIFRVLEGDCILTVGDTDGFLQAGVVINLFMEDQKVRFGINTVSAKKAGLTIRSKLLRLAKVRI